MGGFHMMYGGHGDDGYAGRNQNDHYPTPPFVTRALAVSVSLPRRVWEPACGRGWMSRELKRLGHDVASTDLYRYDDPLIDDAEYGIDFLQAPFRDVDGVVTNPPYDRDAAQKFIERARERYLFCAVLCRLTFAESAKRLSFFTRDPPSRVLVFSQRFSCNEERFETDPLGGMIAFAWWVWHSAYGTGGAEMSWIDTKKEHVDWKRSA